MVVAVLPGSAGSVENRFFRTPVEAGKTLFTFPAPVRFPILQTNVIYRTDLLTDATGGACLCCRKLFIRPFQALPKKSIE